MSLLKLIRVHFISLNTNPFSGHLWYYLIKHPTCDNSKIISDVKIKHQTYKPKDQNPKLSNCSFTIKLGNLKHCVIHRILSDASLNDSNQQKEILLDLWVCNRGLKRYSRLFSFCRIQKAQPRINAPQANFQLNTILPENSVAFNQLVTKRWQ